MTGDRAPTDRAPTDRPSRTIAAFDPGRNLGYALVDDAGRLLDHGVLTLEDLATLELPEHAEVVIGSGTGRRALRSALVARGFEVDEVDEYATTLRARTLWRRANPPRRWARLLPPGLRTPGGPIDDYAAWAIALRHLGLEGDGR